MFTSRHEPHVQGGFVIGRRARGGFPRLTVVLTEARARPPSWTPVILPIPSLHPEKQSTRAWDNPYACLNVRLLI